MRRPLPALSLLALVAVLLLAAAPQDEGATGPDDGEANAVAAFIDTGINPYHVTFRDDSPRAYQHPSTYLPGFPEDAEALHLSLDEDTWQRAIRKDCNIWESIEPGKLYWVPGTKIVGAITFAPDTTDLCEGGTVGIVDVAGHGTMVSSRGASFEYGACRECRIVFVQGFTTDSVRWAGEHADFIDVQSNSWGAFVPAWEPTGVGADTGLTNSPDQVAAIEEAAQRHLAFWATGNGTLTRLGAVGHPTLIDPRMTPSVVMVGGHDSGQVNLWPDFPPHVVSDSCDSWAAQFDSVDESAEDIGSGTSGATPFVAGGAARIALEARRILGDDRVGVRDGVVAEGTPPSGVTDGPLADGVLTLEEWKDLLFKTATPRPERQYEDGSVCDGPLDSPYNTLPINWTDVPADYPAYLHIGYGAVDRPSLELAFQVLRGEAPLPERPDEDAYFSYDRQARDAQHDLWTTGS